MNIRAMVVAALSVCACGCGTLMNTVGEYRMGPPPMGTVYVPPERKIFGGVRRDGENVWECVQTSDTGPFSVAISINLGLFGSSTKLSGDTSTLLSSGNVNPLISLPHPIPN